MGRDLTVLALAGIVAWFVSDLHRSQMETNLSVEGVTVVGTPHRLGCHGTALLLAAVQTNGTAGTLQFHWHRSDGSDSGPLTQDVRAGQKRVELPLRWTVEGRGDFDATATLEISGPQVIQGAATVRYHC